MATIRRKTIENNAAEYLKYARVCGVDLSWNNYERMLPQDGFTRLGLSCADCLQGPCRINPFDRKECKTVCGMDKNDLAYRSLMRLIGAKPGYTEDYMGSVLKACEDICAAPAKASSGCAPTGYGVMDPDMINICFESVPWDPVIAIEKAGAEAAELAASVGAKGFNFSMVGVCCPIRKTVCGLADVEFAVLTGIMDGYVLGDAAAGLGKNAAKAYSTAVMSINEEPMAVLEKAAKAFAARDKAKVRPDTTVIDIPITGYEDLVAESAKYDKIAVIGGGANIKGTVGDSTVKLVKALTDKGIACFTFGNASIPVAKAGITKNVYSTGGKISGLLSYPAIAEKICVVCFPELSVGEDVARAIYMGDKGLKVITATELPIEGAPEFADAIHEKLAYCDADKLVNKVLEIVG